MSVNYPNHYMHVANVVFGTGEDAFNIYSVYGISIDKEIGLLLTGNPNAIRPVAAHPISIQETVSFTFEDINALIQLEAWAENSVITQMTFDWLAAPLQSGPATGNQSVTINNLQIQRID